MDELNNLEVYDNLGKRMLSYYNELFWNLRCTGNKATSIFT